MRIEILSYAEHTRRRDGELAFKQDKRRYIYERWSKARKALLDRLSAHGTIDPTEFGDGDFFVGEDWFEAGVLSIALLTWKTLTPEILHECKAFLAPPYEDFSITVVKSMPAVEDMFELVITRSRTYICFFGKTESEARSILVTNERYNPLRDFLS